MDPLPMNVCYKYKLVERISSRGGLVVELQTDNSLPSATVDRIPLEDNDGETFESERTDIPLFILVYMLREIEERLYEHCLQAMTRVKTNPDT